MGFSLFFAAGWYGIALLPMANVIPLKNGPICDYYLLTPGLGLALFAGWLLEKVQHYSSKPFAYSLAVIWLSAFTITTTLWNPHWQSREALALRTLKWQPDNYVMLGISAKFATDAGKFERAESLLDEGIRLAPWDDQLRYHRVMLFINTGRYEAALDELAGIN